MEYNEHGKLAPRTFFTYAPYVILNTTGLDPFVLDRSIEVILVKSEHTGTSPIAVGGDWDDLREQVHWFMETERVAILEHYNQAFPFLEGRSNEIWAPLEAIAKHLHKDKELLQVKSRLENEKNEEDDSPSKTIRVVLSNLVTHKDYYSAKEILEGLTAYDYDYSPWNEKRLGRQLKRMGLVTSDTKKHTPDGVMYWLAPAPSQTQKEVARHK